MNCKMLLLSILFFLTTNILIAQDGELDISFGMDGKLLSDLTGNSEKAFDVLLQPDGQILVSGTADSTFLIARYHPNGDLDASFANNGHLAISVDFLPSEPYAFLALQPDGKILLSGLVDNATLNIDFFIARINPDGTLDTSFGNDGIQITDFLGYADFGRAIALQPDGKILQAGDASDEMGINSFGLVRYLSDGSLDLDFGNDGKVITPFPGDLPFASAFNIAVQDDLKIVLSGFVISRTSTNDLGRDYAMVRYHPDGSIDQSFGEDGIVVIVTDDLLEFGTGLALQKDQKILSTGQTSLGLIRLNTDGSLDESFGEEGRVLSLVGIKTAGRDVAVQKDNRILVSGMVMVSDLYIFVLARYLSDGSLDPTFGDGGVVFTDFDVDAHSVCNNLAVQDGNEIIAVGYTFNGDNEDFIIVRYLSDLNTQISEAPFLSQEVSLYPNPVSTRATLDYTLAQASTISIDLYETSGKWVKNILAPTQRSAGAQQESIRLEKGLAAGNYFLVISDQDKNLAISLVKK